MSFVRLVLVLLGVVALIFGSMLYEDQERSVHERLENMWIRLDDARQLSVGRRQKELQIVCHAMLRVLNAVFGERLLSARAVWAATMLSLASLCFSLGCASLAVWIYFDRLAAAVPVAVAPAIVRMHGDPNGFADFGFGALQYTLVFTLLATVPALELRAYRADTVSGLLQRHVLQALALAIGAVPLYTLVVIVHAMILALFIGRPEVLNLAIPVWAGVAFDLVFIGLVRVALRKAAENASLWRMFLLVALPSAGAVLVVAGPVQAAAWSFARGSQAGGMIGAALLTDIFDLFLAVAAVACGVLAVAHHAMWPAVQRPLYGLTRLQKPRRYVLIGGVLLIVIGLGKDAASILSWLRLIG